MISMLALIAGIANATDYRSLVISGLDENNYQQVVQQALDDKFSVYGGTITGQVNITTMAVANRFNVANGINFTNTTGNALTFKDATTQNTAYVGQSSSTVLTGNITGTNTSFAGCWASGTFTTNGSSRMFAEITAQASANAATTRTCAVFLLDGAYVSPTASGSGFCNSQMPVGIIGSLYGNILTSVLSAASHTVCVGMFGDPVGAATWTLYGTNGPQVGAVFRVKEHF